MSIDAEQVVERGSKMVDEVIRSMTKHPDRVKVNVAESGAGVVTIQITAHPSDTRRIVGVQGSNLGALSNLTRLLFRGSGKMVQYSRVEFYEVPEDIREGFTPDSEWPKDRIVNLVDRLSRAVFDCKEVTVEAIDVPDSVTVINVKVGVVSDAVRRFGSAMSKVFNVIGNVHGRILMVRVNEEKERGL